MCSCNFGYFLLMFNRFFLILVVLYVCVVCGDFIIFGDFIILILVFTFYAMCTVRITMCMHK